MGFARKKIWLPSGRGLPIFVLIIFPSLATLFVTIVYYYVRFTSVHFEITTNGMRLVGPSYAIFLIKALVPFELAVMAVMFIGYPLYTYVYQYFGRKYNKEYFTDVVLEYECIKKVLWIAIPLLSIIWPLSIVYSLVVGSIGQYMPVFIQDADAAQHIKLIRLLLWLVVGAGLVKMVSLLMRKEFRFDVARGWVELVSKKKDEVEKMEYLMNGLDSYNKYIRKRLKTSINVFQIYSKIIHSPTDERNESIRIIAKTFEIDKLGVLNQLPKDRKKEQFSGRDALMLQIQQLGTDVGWLISAMIGIIGAVVSIITTVQSLLQSAHLRCCFSRRFSLRDLRNPFFLYTFLFYVLISVL